MAKKFGSLSRIHFADKPVLVDWYHGRTTADKNSVDKVSLFRDRGLNPGVLYITDAKISGTYDFFQSMRNKDIKNNFAELMLNPMYDCVIIVVLYHHWEKIQLLIKEIRKKHPTYKFWDGNFDEGDVIAKSKRFKAINNDWYQITKTSTATTQENDTSIRSMKNPAVWGPVVFNQSYTEAVLKQKVKKPLFAFPDVYLSELADLCLRINKKNVPQIYTKLDIPNFPTGVDLPTAYMVLYVIGFIKTFRQHPKFITRLDKVGTREQGRTLRALFQYIVHRICDPKDPTDALLFEMAKNTVVLNEKPVDNKANQKIVKRVIKKGPCYIIQCQVLDRGYDEPAINATGLFTTPDDEVVIWQFLFRGNRRNWDIPFDDDEQLIYCPCIIDDVSEKGEDTYWSHTTKSILKIAKEFKPIWCNFVEQVYSNGNKKNKTPPQPPQYISPVSFKNTQHWMEKIRTMVQTHGGQAVAPLQKTLFLEMHEKALQFFTNPNDKTEIQNFYKLFNDHPILKILIGTRPNARKGATYNHKKGGVKAITLSKVFNGGYHWLDKDPECLDIMDQFELFKDKYHERRRLNHEAFARCLIRFIDSKSKWNNTAFSLLSKMQEVKDKKKQLKQLFGLSEGRDRTYDFHAMKKTSMNLTHVGKLLSGRHPFPSAEFNKETAKWFNDREQSLCGAFDKMNDDFMNSIDNFYDMIPENFAKDNNLHRGWFVNKVIGHPKLTAEYHPDKLVISHNQYKKFDKWIQTTEQKTIDITDKVVNEYIRIHELPENYNKEEGSSRIEWKKPIANFVNKITGRKAKDSQSIVGPGANIDSNNWFSDNTKKKLRLWSKERQKRIDNLHNEIRYMFAPIGNRGKKVIRRATKLEVLKKFKVSHHLIDKLYEEAKK